MVSPPAPTVVHAYLAVLEREPEVEMGAQAIVRCGVCSATVTVSSVGNPDDLALRRPCTGCGAPIHVDLDWRAELRDRGLLP